MVAFRPSTAAGLAISLAVGALSVTAVVSAVTGQDLLPPASLRTGFPAPACSRSAAEEAVRIEQLVQLVEKARVKAARNPLLSADAAYYEAELAATRRCMQAFAER